MKFLNEDILKRLIYDSVNFCDMSDIEYSTIQKIKNRVFINLMLKANIESKVWTTVSNLPTDCIPKSRFMFNLFDFVGTGQYFYVRVINGLLQIYNPTNSKISARSIIGEISYPIE